MNIAEILKYCPKGTKLYSTVFGEVKFSEVYPNNMIVVIIKDDFKRVFHKDGSYSEYGECVLFPAKDQRDWDKFRLPVKKGDIMMNYDGSCPFIVAGELYENILPKYICGINLCGEFIKYPGKGGWTTDFYIPASKEAKKELFDKMTEAGYRWNAYTLELEKIKPEFKEGDVLINEEGNLYLLVGRIAKDIGKAAILYANGDFIAEAAFTITSDGLTLAKSSDRNKLFSFLVRKGYKYDKEQHKLIKQEFKPFDKVLVRNNTDEKWRINLFSRYDEKDKEYPFICMDNHYRYCTPYKGNEYLLVLQYNF